MIKILIGNTRKVALIFMLSLCAVMTGFSIGASGELFTAFAAIIVLSVCGIAFLLCRNPDQTLWIFLLAWLPLFIEPFLFRLTGVALFPIWQSVMTLVAALGLTFFLKELRHNLWLKCWVCFSFLFLFYGCLSSVLGRTNGFAGAYQLISNIKPMLLVLTGFALRKDIRIEKVIWFTVSWLWLPMVIFIAWEWLSPGSYFSLLPGGPKGSDLSPISFVPTRAFGFFDHPAMMATYAVYMAFLAAGACIRRTDTIKNAFLVIVYTVVVICTTQRQELSALLISLCLLYVVLARNDVLIRRTVKSGVLCLVFLMGFVVMNFDSISQEMLMWGVEGNSAESPRSQLFSGAVYIADSFFPLGSGLGTYGGAGAFKFDWSLYDYLGFGKYWWYGKKNYLMDTYWPNSIAETGYVGALFLLCSYFFLFMVSFSATRENLKKYLSTSYFPETCVMLIYMVQLSISSPAFQDPRLFMIPALFFGYSFVRLYNGVSNDR